MASNGSRRDALRAHLVSSDSEASSIPSSRAQRRKKQRRDANVYDAVAGRVTTTQPLAGAYSLEQISRRHQRSTLRDPTLAPEEVLFRRVGAPIRYAEKDIYHAHERLPDGGRGELPDSDMLKAIHSYASQFYASLTVVDEHNSKNVSERSMDETALLAFGILLEEAGREALGKKGDLVFTEGVLAVADGQSDNSNGEAIGFLDEAPSQAQKRRR
ncbi:hypothetical protein BX600DRAFT_243856 [Xylariales sp. PMI_506]|nr:hypothetical protein BX600DRAFT_243856 [Xylariales sp. PMI_506]